MNNPAQAAPAEVRPQEAMLKLISGFWISRAIYIAAKLGVADLIKDQPRTVDELAAATGTHAASLYRVLRALASVGVFAEDGDLRFSLTPLAGTLQSGVPGSLRAFAMTELGEEHYPAWGDLMHSVRTGEIAFDHHFGTDVWKFFEQHPENARIFNDAMSGLTAAANEAILARYDFSAVKKLVDIGGGHGGLITSILKANRSMNGVLFDSPQVIEGAQTRLEAAGLADRCEIIAGDFFKAVPAGGDGYILKWIIHDWDEERATTILRNCRRAITNDGRLMVIEAVIPPGIEPHFAKFIDLNMLVMTGGRERTEEEFRRLFGASGFRLTRTVATESPFSVIEGAPM